jgi:hypothetical protein
MFKDFWKSDVIAPEMASYSWKVLQSLKGFRRIIFTQSVWDLGRDHVNNAIHRRRSAEKSH